MPHRDDPETRRLRAAALAERAGLDEPTAGDQATLLGRVKTATPQVGRFFLLNPATITDPTDLLFKGLTATIAVGTPDIPVYLHGVEGDPRLTGPPVAVNVLTADLVDYRWATWRPPPPNPGGCFGCDWPTVAPFPSLSLTDPYQSAPVPLTTTDGIHYTGCAMADLCADTIQKLEIVPTSDGRLPTSGHFQLSADGTTNPTAFLNWNASAADVATAIAGLSWVGAGNVACTGGPLPGTPITIQFQGTLACTNVAVLHVFFGSDTLTDGISFFTPSIQVTATGGGTAAAPVYYDLDLSVCALTVVGITDNTFGTCHGPAAGKTCADLPDGPAGAGNLLNTWQFPPTATACNPLSLTFDTSSSASASFLCFYEIDAYRPPPVYTITKPAPPNATDGLGGPFARARCLGTRGDLSTTFTLTDPAGTGPVTLTFGAGWALPLTGGGLRPGWWGCGTVVVPNQCAGTGTITVPVVYFLDQQTCGFLLYYLAATLNGLGVPTDGCASKTAPRAGTCSGGDGAGQGYGISGVLANTLLPVIGQSPTTPNDGPIGAAWIAVDSYFPLHITATIDPAGGRALYGTATPPPLTITG